MVARLTPDQKAACSNHVGVTIFLIYPRHNKHKQDEIVLHPGLGFLKNTLPPMRIELMTFGLQDQRSATEL